MEVLEPYFSIAGVLAFIVMIGVALSRTRKESTERCGIPDSLEKFLLNVKVVAVAALIVFVAYLSQSLISFILPIFIWEFGLAFSEAGFIISASALPAVIFALLAGMLASRLGGKAFTTSVFVVGLASNLLLFIATRNTDIITSSALQGIFLGSALTLGVIMINRSSSPQKVGASMGMYFTASLLGITFGPFIFGNLVVSWGWRLSLIPLMICQLFGLLLALTMVPHKFEFEEKKIYRPEVAFIICQNCGEANHPSHSYCGKCGYTLKTGETKIY